MNKLKGVLVLALVSALLAGLQPAIAAPRQNANVSAAEIYRQLTISKMSTLSLPDGAKVRGSRIIVKLKEGYKLNWKDYDLTLGQDEPALIKRNIYVVNSATSNNVMSAIRRLAQLREVEYAQPDYAYKMNADPNDEYYADQWGLKKINIPEAWDITEGSSDVTVAVLDTGVDARHPDLTGRVLEGYDFVNNDVDPSDDNGHGTMVAGVIAAVADNGIGIAGVDKKCKILPVKAANSDGLFYSTDIIEGIYYAIDKGADIINMSFGGQMNIFADRPVSDALAEAEQKDIVLVAASGNEATNVSFPALYAPVIAVGASGKTDERADFSNYGPPLDIMGPGVDIYTAYSDGKKIGYASATGTSLAAPFVSAVASLLLAKDQDLTPAEVCYLIEASAAKPSLMSDDEWDEYYGYGRLDAYAALKQSLPDLSRDVPDSLQQAEPIYGEQNISQRIDMPMDLDCYKVNTTYFGRVKVTVNVPAGLDMTAVVYDSFGNQTRLFDKAPLGKDENFAFIVQPGTYYIALTDANLHWSVEPYSIRVSGPVKAAQLPDGN